MQQRKIKFKEQLECCKCCLDFDLRSPSTAQIGWLAVPCGNLFVCLFWIISITSNHGIVAESPFIKRFLVTAAVYCDSVLRVNCSSSIRGMFIRNCRVDASSDALDFGVLVCMMLWGPELEQWEASSLCVWFTVFVELFPAGLSTSLPVVLFWLF